MNSGPLTEVGASPRPGRGIKAHVADRPSTTAPAEDEGGESQEEEQGHTQESPLCTATTPEVLAVAQQVLCGLVGG